MSFIAKVKTKRNKKVSFERKYVERKEKIRRKESCTLKGKLYFLRQYLFFCSACTIFEADYKEFLNERARDIHAFL